MAYSPTHLTVCIVAGDQATADALKLRLESDYGEAAMTCSIHLEQRRGEPGDHGATAQTPYKFTFTRAWGTVVEDSGVLEDLGLDDDELAEMTSAELESRIAAEHTTWLLEQVQDSSGYSYGAGE